MSVRRYISAPRGGAGGLSGHTAHDVPHRVLDKLMASEAGQCLLVNIEDSLEERLVEAVVVVDFLCRMARALDTATEPPQLDDWVNSARIGDRAHADAGLMRLFRVADASHDGTRWSTVVTWNGFFGHQLDRAQLDRRGAPIPDQKPWLSADEVNAQLNAIRNLVPRWWQEPTQNGGHLGLPPERGGTCWVGRADIGEAPAAGLMASPGSPAGTASRADEENFALGLGFETGTCLLRWHFDADSARRAAEGDVARPSFSDLGNKWFRVCDESPQGRRHALEHWGTTAHTGADNAKQRAPLSGRAERTVRAMPIGELSGLSVECLGHANLAADVIHQRQHLKNMLGRRKINAVHGRLKRLVRRAGR